MSVFKASFNSLQVIAFIGALTGCGAEEELPPTVISPTSPVSEPAPNTLIRSDFDQDAYPDFVMTSQGVISIWFMKILSTVLSLQSTAPVASIPLDSAVVGSADFDRDGKMDLLVLNNTSKKLSILKLTGAAGSTYEYSLPLTSSNGAAEFSIPSSHAVAGTVDYDFDGDPDILIWNALAGNDLRILKFQGRQFVSEEVLVDSANNPAGAGAEYLIVGLYEFPSENRWRIFWQAKTSHPTAGTAGTIYRWSMNGKQKVSGETESGIIRNVSDPLTPINLKAASPWVVAGVRKYPGDASISMILQNPTAQTSSASDYKYVRWKFNASLEYTGFEYVAGTALTVGQTPPSIQPN